MITADTRLFTIRVTALFPDVDHAVTDEEMAARNEENRGDYRALCGAVFLPAPSTRGPGRWCPECARFAWARATLADMQDRVGASRRAGARNARSGWWGRLFGCRRGR